MTRSQALILLRNYIEDKLHAKRSTSVFYLIDGGRICGKCRANKRRTLYMIVADNAPVMLKCFRASCTADFLLSNPDTDATKARVITHEELLQLGFNNEEAITEILNCKDFIHKKTKSLVDRTVLVQDTELSKYQKAYIKKRCNFMPSKYEMDKYHVVADINEVIDDNDIQMSSEISSMYKCYDKDNAITFLCNNVTLSTRAISPEVRMQKSIINISNNITSSGYTIGDSLNNKHTLVLTEGIFDIINAERYFAVFDDPGVLYAASLGFGKSANIIENFFYKNIETMKTLILFMDSDISTMVHGVRQYIYNEKQLYTLLKSLDNSLGEDNFKDIYVCYNTKNKDCGDLSQEYSMKRETIDRAKLYGKYEKYNKKWR